MNWKTYQFTWLHSKGQSIVKKGGWFLRSKFVPPGVFFCIKVGKEMRVLKLCECVCVCKRVEENGDLLREKQTFISAASLSWRRRAASMNTKCRYRQLISKNQSFAWKYFFRGKKLNFHYNEISQRHDWKRQEW